MLNCFSDVLLSKTDAQKLPESRKCQIKLIFKSLIISSFGKLMVIPLVIWNPNEIYFNLALLFTYLSNSKALSGEYTLSALLSTKIFLNENFFMKFFVCFFFFSIKVCTNLHKKKASLFIVIAGALSDYFFNFVQQIS